MSQSSPSSSALISRGVYARSRAGFELAALVLTAVLGLAVSMAVGNLAEWTHDRGNSVALLFTAGSLLLVLIALLFVALALSGLRTFMLLRQPRLHLERDTVEDGASFRLVYTQYIHFSARPRLMGCFVVDRRHFPAQDAEGSFKSSEDRLWAATLLKSPPAASDGIWSVECSLPDRRYSVGPDAILVKTRVELESGLEVWEEFDLAQCPEVCEALRALPECEGSATLTLWGVQPSRAEMKALRAALPYLTRKQVFDLFRCSPAIIAGNVDEETAAAITAGMGNLASGVKIERTPSSSGGGVAG